MAVKKGASEAAKKWDQSMGGCAGWPRSSGKHFEGLSDRSRREPKPSNLKSRGQYSRFQLPNQLIALGVFDRSAQT